MSEARPVGSDTDKSRIDENNASFWNELCGSQLAKSLGIEDDKPASLKKFDDWYFDFYPYLTTYIPFGEMKGRDVLDIGLGYGTVAQRLAEAGARYEGLDIAAGPVAMVNHRLKQAGLPGRAQQGSILEAPFADASFDYVTAIGCLHHTGNLEKAIDECHRVLRPGGKLIFMVYYAYSYRRFLHAPRDTLSYLGRELTGYRGIVGGRKVADERAAYDANEAGDAAPHTDWISARSLRRYCHQFKSFSARPDNIDNGAPFRRARPREELLKTPLPRFVGLDLYATAVK